MISAYNNQAPPVNNLVKIVSKEIKVFGFLVFSLTDKYGDAFYREVPAQVARGELKYLEDVTKGLENAGHALYNVQTGRNYGKSVVQVADE